MRGRRPHAAPLLLCLLLFLCQCCTSARRLAAPPEQQFDSDAAIQDTSSAPIIGVLSQPLGARAPNASYFPASYSKYAAMAGARVVPVLCDASRTELRALYAQINGLIVPGAPCGHVPAPQGCLAPKAPHLHLTPPLRQPQALCAGGAQDLRPGNPYYDTMSLFTDLAMQDFDERGEVFPIHYTCLGWEAIAVKVTDNPYILSASPIPCLCSHSHRALACAPQATLHRASTHECGCTRFAGMPAGGSARAAARTAIAPQCRPCFPPVAVLIAAWPSKVCQSGKGLPVRCGRTYVQATSPVPSASRTS